LRDVVEGVGGHLCGGIVVFGGLPKGAFGRGGQRGRE
jgi:hypothetical protein